LSVSLCVFRALFPGVMGLILYRDRKLPWCLFCVFVPNRGKLMGFKLNINEKKFKWF
jgi:hypothetical protein